MEVGDRVVIKTYSKLPYSWSDRMCKWMGKVVTIRLIVWNGVYIKEDINDFSDNEYPGWIWNKDDFIPLSEIKDSIRHLLGG